MKKLGIITLFAGIVCIYSCDGIDSNSPFTEENFSSDIIQGVRKFSTVSDYELILKTHSLPEYPEFISMSKVISDPLISDSESARIWQEDEFLNDLSDAFLLEIIDSDGMIIIEDYLIKLDFNKRLAFVTDNLDRLVDFRNEVYDFNDVESYDFEQDVLGILFGEDESKTDQTEKDSKENARIAGDGCPGAYPPGSLFPPKIGSGCDSRKCQWTRIYSEAGWSYKAEAKHVYQAAAIYFRLKSEIAHFKNNESNSTGWSSEPIPGMTITHWGSYTPKNRSAVQLSSCYDLCEKCGPVIANTDKVQKIHWEEGRRLISFNLYGIYEVHLGGSHAQSGYPDVFQLYNIQE